MRIEIHTDDHGLRPDVERAVERKISKLERRLQHYHPDACELRITVDRDRKNTLFKCTLDLKVPGKNLVVRKESFDQRGLVEDAFDALFREWDKYRLKVNKSLRSRKVLKPVRLEAATSEVENWDALFREILLEQLPGLYRVARHELLNCQMMGLMEPGQLTPEEIVDEAILATYPSMDPDKGKMEIARMLYRNLIQVLNRYLKEAREKAGRFVPVEEETRPLPEKEETVLLGEEILHFWEPDQVVKIEDEIPDPAAVNPAELLEREDLQKLLYRLLGTLPDQERMAFLLVVMEGFTLEEAGMILNVSPENVGELVEKATGHLIRQFSRSGVELEAGELKAFFAQLKDLPFALPVEEEVESIFAEIRHTPLGAQ